jgi:C4-dicarboxylate-specific signal transduction histidine kinase
MAERTMGAPSLATAALLVTLIPQALALPSPEQLRTANTNLEKKIRERLLVEEALQRAHSELESKVQQQTAELARANDQLRGEIGERRRAEDALWYPSQVTFTTNKS